SFREEKNYIVDVGFQSDKPKESPLSAASHAAEKPAKDGGHSEEIKPPTSETIAKQMKAEAKPDVAAPAVKEAAASPQAAEAAREGSPVEAAKPAEMAKPTVAEAKPVAVTEKEAKAPPA